MPSINRSFGLLALSVAALAQTTVVDVIIPGWDAESFYASVKGVEKSVTTYVFECRDDTDPLECGLPYGGTIIQGESTWSQSTSFSAESESQEVIATYACDVDRPNDSMVCELSQLATYDGTTETQSTTETVSGIKTLYQAVTVTAGADKLDPSPGASTAAPETTATETETDTTVTTATATGTESGSTAEPTDDGAEETESDNAGPRATQNAIAVGVVGIIGAAAAVL